MLRPRPWPQEPLPEILAPAAPPELVLADRSDPLLHQWLDHFFAFLSAQEQERMQRYRRLEDRERFLIGRGVLRLLLARLTGSTPERLCLGEGPHGKPFLLPDPAGSEAHRSPPRFNLSHSGDLVLVGVHAVREVGVDLEKIREEIDWLPIARRCLPAKQVELIQRRSVQDRPQEFLRLWCRLEARLKASGVGFAAGGPSRGPEDRCRALPLWDVLLPTGYAGAVALE